MVRDSPAKNQVSFERFLLVFYLELYHKLYYNSKHMLTFNRSIYCYDRNETPLGINR